MYTEVQTSRVNCKVVLQTPRMNGVYDICMNELLYGYDCNQSKSVISFFSQVTVKPGGVTMFTIVEARVTSA